VIVGGVAALRSKWIGLPPVSSSVLTTMAPNQSEPPLKVTAEFGAHKTVPLRTSCADPILASNADQRLHPLIDGCWSN
jgi:hypothetical protein